MLDNKLLFIVIRATSRYKKGKKRAGKLEGGGRRKEEPSNALACRRSQSLEGFSPDFTYASYPYRGDASEVSSRVARLED